MKSMIPVRLFIISLCSIFSMVQAQSSAALNEFCSQKKGEIVKRYKCPNTSFPLLTPVCIFKSSGGVTQFTDGCTGPSGGHRELFTNSCIAHDLCYHHEPSTSGKTQKDCDLEFKSDLLHACNNADDFEKCENWAKVMYKALRAFGGLAYKCDDSSIASCSY